MTSEEFDAEWDRCKGWLCEALEYCHGSWTIDDVRDLVLRDENTWFWPGKNSAVVTEIIQNPRVKQLHMWLCAGDMAELVNLMLPSVEAWGALAGCSRFSTAGRPGWKRVLAPHGYGLSHEVCYKDLTA